MKDKRKIDIIEQISEFAQKAEVDGALRALKVCMTSSESEAESLAEKLRAEISLLAFSEIFSSGNCVVAMRDWIAGMPLRMQRAAPLDALADIVKIADALLASGIVHGDLKPENVIADESGAFVLTDFCARKFYEVTKGTNGTGISYLAPEQINGTTDEKSDVYALGVILGKILCGKTPFDGKPDDAVLDEKQNSNGPDWSALEIMQVPAEISEIVRKATVSDANARYQSVTELRDACESAMRRIESGGGVSSSSSAPTAGSEPASDEPEPIPLNPNKRFVLVGHTGAGKTVLAAGLYATFSRKKSLSVEAADEQTKQLANNFKTLIETNSWPAATTGAAQKLSFRIAHEGNAAELDFDEYMGERTSDVESYIRDILKIPDGVLLLMNPGGIQFRSKGEDDTKQAVALRRNKLLSDLESIIDYLFKLKKRPSVALVITASDRLKSDLKDFAGEFSRYVEKIESALDSRDKTWWKRFDISVCGELEDQNKPRLDPQGIEEPFLWLLERHDLRERKARMKKIALRSAGMLCAAAAVAAAWWGIDFYRAGVPAKETLACAVKYSGRTDEQDLLNLVKELVDIRIKYCSEKHIADEKNLGLRLGVCTSRCSPFFLFRDRSRAFDENIRNLEVAIDAAKASLFEFRMKRALKEASETNCDSIADGIASWRLLQDDETVVARSGELKRQCAEDLPPARERYAYEKFVEVLKEVETSPQKGLRDLPERIEAFLASPTALPEEEHARNTEELKRLLLAARERVFVFQADELEKKIKTFSPQKIDDWTPVVSKWNHFLADQPKDVPAQIVSDKFSALSLCMKKTFDDFLLGLCEKYRDRQMKSQKELKAEFDAELEAKLYPEFPPEFAAAFRALVKTNISGTLADWDKLMASIVADFITKETGRGGADMLRDFREFFYENADNPYLENAEKFVANAVFKSLDGITQPKEWKNTEREYLAVKELCAAIRATPSKYIQAKKMFTFANAYIEWLDGYSRNIKVLEGRLRSLGRTSDWGNPYWVEDTYDSRGNYCAGHSPVLYSGWYRYPDTTWTFSLKKPWEEYTLRMSLKDDGKIYDSAQGTRSWTWSNPGVWSAGKNKVAWDGFELDVEISGKTIWDIWNESFKGN